MNISPLSRIEGHAAISIQLDDSGQVSRARLHVREFRGFESFCVGRPFWEMPAITARICGICPASHALAAAQAGDAILGVAVPPAAGLLRRLLSLAQLILSHSLSFYHLSAPDILLGLDADPAERNIVGLFRRYPEIIRQGIRLRQIAQQIVNLVGGGHLHPQFIVPGGMARPLSAEGRDGIAALLPEALELVQAALVVWRDHGEGLKGTLGDEGGFSGLQLGLVGDDGCLEHSSGRLRFVDEGGATLREADPAAYGTLIGEIAADDSYMKATEYRGGGAGPFYRVGPLARLNVAPFRHAPLANAERARLLNGSCPAAAVNYHHARLIEMLYAVEALTLLMDDDGLISPEVLVRGEVVHREGTGATEAPRGTLIHHYRVDCHGLLTGVNLLVATGHNSRAMDDTITGLARRHIQGERLSEGLLNRVEHGIRIYDPCLSCATHTHGRLGMAITLHSSDGSLLDQGNL